MADDFDDFIADLDDNTLQNSALSLSKLLELDTEHEDGGFEKLLGKLNDKDLEDIIDLDTLEQLEKDFMADEQTSSGDSPDQSSESPPLKVQKRKLSPGPAPAGKRPPKGKGKRVPDEEIKFKEPEKVYCICRQPQNNRFMICCDSCEEWYHGDCVGISLERGREMEKASEDYTCSKCLRAKEKPTPQAHIPSSLREKAKSLKVATVVPTKHYSADTKYNRFDTYDHVDRSSTKCKIDGCPEYAMRNSPFCSEKCVLKFAQDNMKSTTAAKIKSETTERQEIRGYEEKKLSQPNPLRLTVRKHLKTLLSTRAKEATDLLVTEDEIVKIAQNIEMSLYKLYPDCGSRYKAKCKAICFNISDSKNLNLYRNILSGTLSSEKLAKMSPEEMSVRVKAKQLQVNPASSAAAAVDSTVNIMDMLGDTTAQHGTHVFDVKCRKCTGKVAKQKEPKPPPKPNPESDPYAEPVPNRLALSAKPLKDPLGLNPALWKGYITMTSLTKFATSGYHVYGPHESLLSTLPDTLHVQGRIANNIVWAYVDRLRNSPVKELIILKFESQNGEEVQGYSNLFHYLHTRTRCGVIGNVTAPVRDMYLVPLSAEGSIPPQLRLLGVSSIPKKNRANLILGLIVVNKVGAKRPREPQVEALNPDKDQDPPTSRDSNTPGSLEHLSSFPTDVSLPFNLGGGGGAGDAGAASDEGAASDDDGSLD